MKRLNDTESRQAGEAVGTILGFADRLINGNCSLTVEQERKIKEANEHLKSFTLEEQLELFIHAFEGSVD